MLPNETISRIELSIPERINKENYLGAECIVQLYYFRLSDVLFYSYCIIS